MSNHSPLPERFREENSLVASNKVLTVEGTGVAVTELLKAAYGPGLSRLLPVPPEVSKELLHF